MSYSISIEYHDGTRRSFPLAPEGIYTRFWETPAQALSLVMIPAIVDTLFLVEQKQAEIFRNEMRVLRAYHQDGNEDTDGDDMERLTRLIKVFDDAIVHWDIVKYIFVS
jgi:hypothetical protein